MSNFKEKYNQEFVNKVHEMKATHYTHDEIAKTLKINTRAVSYILKNRSYDGEVPKDEVLEIFHEAVEEEKPTLWQRIKTKLKFWQK